MNYYEHHLGDYAAATAHLSWDEDMAYTRLLRAYYHHERGIPDGQQYRLARATTPAQRRAVDSVLSEFFKLVAGAFTQKRADAEIARFQDKQRKASASANARWNKHQPHTERNANASPDAMRTHSEGNAPRHQTPDTIEIQEEASPPVDSPPLATPQRPPCPTEEIVSRYHELCPSLPRVSVLNDARRKAISTRWREVITDPEIRKAADPKDAALDWWGWFFREVHGSDFLAGRSKDWHATFDWLMKPTNFAKVVDGNFSNQRRTG